jgi:uncharacterized protein YrrD
MDFHFGSAVRERDGGKIGELRRLVYDPETRQVVSLVVEEGLLEARDRVVPIGAVATADDDAVSLELSHPQFDSLPEYAVERNVAPPPELQNQVPDQIKEPFDVPDVPPVGAATGIESIAYTPVMAENVRVPREDEVIDGGSVVWATDGEIGKVKDVITDDETNRIVTLVVESGTIFTHDTDIPFTWVETVRPETIVLNVEKSVAKGGRHD